MGLIRKENLHRRRFLRSASATLALPFLESLVPKHKTLHGTRSDQASDPTRLVAIEIVHGAAGSTKWGATQNYWSPASEGNEFDLSPTALSSLTPFKNQLTIVSDTDVANAEAVIPKEIGGDHFRSSSVFLTQEHPKQTESSDVFVGTSLDQIYAQEFGQETPIPSMQLCIENVDQAGGCAYGYSCVYTDTLSWSSPTEPLPMIRDPRVAFDLMFGAGGTQEEREIRRKTRRSILDFVIGEVKTLQGELDAVDKRRMERYLTNVREIERRIQKVVERNKSNETRELPEAPAGVPDSFDEHVKLMFDLQALAFEADITRVFSFKMGRDASSRVYPLSGVDNGFHPASHHGDKEKNIEEFFRINRYHASLIPYFLSKLKDIEEAGTTLLDKTMVIYGSPMGDPHVHNHKRCPLLVVGGANGKHKGGIHYRAKPGTPMANVMLTLLHQLGFEDMTAFGDSTEAFSLKS